MQSEMFSSMDFMTWRRWIQEGVIRHPDETDAKHLVREILKPRLQVTHAVDAWDYAAIPVAGRFMKRSQPQAPEKRRVGVPDGDGGVNFHQLAFISEAEIVSVVAAKFRTGYGTVSAGVHDADEWVRLHPDTELTVGEIVEAAEAQYKGDG